MSYAGGISFERTTTIPAVDEFIMAGKMWRIGHYFSKVGTNVSALITFKTPADAITLYELSSVGKTGGEVEFSMIEAPTSITGTPTAITPYNVCRLFKDNVCGLTELGYGLSSAITIVGGVVTPPDYLPGENQGSQRQAGTAAGGGFIQLLPDTQYILEAKNLGTTDCNINILFKMAVDL